MIPMLKSLDHVTLRSTDLGRTLAFYERLLGLEPGCRSAFGMQGLWLYAEGRSLVHVLEMPVDAWGGAIHHIAFEARDRLAVSARLAAARVPFELTALPDGSALQMFLTDPDGARVELVFRHPEDR